MGRPSSIYHPARRTDSAEFRVVPTPLKELMPSSDSDIPVKRLPAGLGVYVSTFTTLDTRRVHFALHLDFFLSEVLETSGMYP